MSARIRMNGVADDALIPTPPTGKATLFYNNVFKVYRAKLDDGSVITLSSDPEFIQDTVGSLFQDSTTIDFTYDDAGNVAYIEVIQTALDISLIPNVPTGNLTATTLQGALNELQGDIDNINANAVRIFQEIFTITQDNIDSGSLVLARQPISPSTTSLVPIGGPPQVYNVDFEIIDDVVSFVNLGLEGFLEVGDKLIVTYLNFTNI